MRHLIQICNIATGSKVVSWTDALNSQLQLRDLRELRNHCVRIYPQVAYLTAFNQHLGSVIDRNRRRLSVTVTMRILSFILIFTSTE